MPSPSRNTRRKLELVASGAGVVSWTDGSCSWNTGAAWARLRLRPSCDLVPFLPVTRFSTEIDGQLWHSSGVGATTASANEVLTGKTVSLLWAACSNFPPAGSVSPGNNKQITVRAHVVGATDDPAPAVLTLDLDCDTDAGLVSPPNTPEGLVDLIGPCISDFDAAVPAVDAGDGSVDDGGYDATSADSAGDDSGAASGGGAAGCSDCSDAALPSAAGSPLDVRASGGCSHDSRGSSSAAVRSRR